MVYEGYVHDLFRRGGEFTVDKLAILSNTTVTVLLLLQTENKKSLSQNYFTSGANLTEYVKDAGSHYINRDVVGRYFLLYTHNNVSCDGLLFICNNTLICLEMRIAKSHTIKDNGLNALCKYLLAAIINIYIVFVIPAE